MLQIGPIFLLEITTCFPVISWFIVIVCLPLAHQSKGCLLWEAYTRLFPIQI